MKYIDADKLIDEIRKLRKTNKSEAAHISEYVQGGIYGFGIATDKITEIISHLQQEQESVTEQFAKIVRANLSEIGKNVQSQFEQLYFEITGTKMYGGYND